VIAVKDIERFRVSARNGRRMGLYGKLCIHPDQVAPCNEVFTPDAAQLAHARAVVEAFERAEASGSASIQVNGQFVDYPIVFKARRILAAAARAGG
jgi:citrate lyase subunit beta/citryl-CoA lyase